MKQEELENYIDMYGRELYSFCCCVTRSCQEADDLYQDTFLKLYECFRHIRRAQSVLWAAVILKDCQICSSKYFS